MSSYTQIMAHKMFFLILLMDKVLKFGMFIVVAEVNLYLLNYLIVF